MLYQLLPAVTVMNNKLVIILSHGCYIIYQSSVTILILFYNFYFAYLL